MLKKVFIEMQKNELNSKKLFIRFLKLDFSTFFSHFLKAQNESKLFSGTKSVNICDLSYRSFVASITE